MPNLFSAVGRGFQSAFMEVEGLSMPSTMRSIRGIWSGEGSFIGKTARSAWTATGGNVITGIRHLSTLEAGMGPISTGTIIGQGVGSITKGVGAAWAGMGAINIFRPGDNLGLF